MNQLRGNTPQSSNDVIIIGAGAAGMMCAIEAGKRVRRTLLIERNPVVGEKIRISGGGRCNFTNLKADNSNYISSNPHFCKSAMARFTTEDFVALVEKHGIRYHEKKLGQLFCDGRSQEIIAMLLKECSDAGVTIVTGCEVSKISKEAVFTVTTNQGVLEAPSLVIATGGLSIPQIGATNFGYMVAEQFGVKVTPLRPGLVPLIVDLDDFKPFKNLSGVSIDAEVSCNGMSFRENILFTHRGLSGPAILQISSFWREGIAVMINLLPDVNPEDFLEAQRQSGKDIDLVLSQVLPKRFVETWLVQRGGSRPILRYSKQELAGLAHALSHWKILPTGTEGFGKAEVTVGGVQTDDLSSKTMESKKVPGLFFVGEVVDVTGWLGGYNFQWAWASGWVAGQFT
ncbi:MAG: NAD(P)/FAD-dependent oxidoreductase [Bacteroidota bacterium]